MVGVALAIGLGVAVPALDEALGGDTPFTFVFGGGPSAARDVLAAIAGSLVSVTGLTFSLTVVALQLGSSQYSPRLLQTFTRDRVVQVTLAQLVLTFVYALTVLRTVRTQDDESGTSAFVPRLSVTLAYLLTLGSVVALLLFLGHLARSLRVETMLRDVHDEAMSTFDEEVGSGPARPVPALPTGPPSALPARSSGFVVHVDEARIVAAATRCDAVVVLVPRIGDGVVAGVPVAHTWLPDGADAGQLQEALDAGVELDFERHADRDLGYGLRTTVDVVSRALSSGINDPTTAVHGLGHVSALLGDLAHRSLGPASYTDDGGRLRLVVPQWSYADLLEVALEEPVQYAEGSPAVLRRLAALLREVAWRAPAGVADEALRHWWGRLEVVAARTSDLPAAVVEQWRTDLEDALAEHWAPR
ncbi:Uncharacterized membrane protein [Klenkia marina]|uniref:Uncharacterized membrane protein n=1 Tax=Klenkia marina TaxID=1960309 RepID=A0A1G4XEX9_9ACTN|nr:Uncharacterized membrane protein [Klenkia marina]